eukprot:scaffold301_cov243-Pinguiococcus_pyrenoidosus.AAC.39
MRGAHIKGGRYGEGHRGVTIAIAQGLVRANLRRLRHGAPGFQGREAAAWSLGFRTRRLAPLGHFQRRRQRAPLWRVLVEATLKVEDAKVAVRWPAAVALRVASSQLRWLAQSPTTQRQRSSRGHLHLLRLPRRRSVLIRVRHQQHLAAAGHLLPLLQDAGALCGRGLAALVVISPPPGALGPRARLAAAGRRPGVVGGRHRGWLALRARTRGPRLELGALSLAETPRPLAPKLLDSRGHIFRRVGLHHRRPRARGDLRQRHRFPD